jgi:hypothetical protein
MGADSFEMWRVLDRGKAFKGLYPWSAKAFCRVLDRAEKEMLKPKDDWRTLDAKRELFLDNEAGGVDHDGPAVEWSNGLKEWWVSGKHIRTDSPS